MSKKRISVIKEKKLLEKTDIIDFINTINEFNNDTCADCCHCTVANGECYQIASQGRCNAWNSIDNKSEAIKKLEELKERRVYNEYCKC